MIAIFEGPVVNNPRRKAFNRATGKFDFSGGYCYPLQSPEWRHYLVWSRKKKETSAMLARPLSVRMMAGKMASHVKFFPAGSWEAGDAPEGQFAPIREEILAELENPKPEEK